MAKRSKTSSASEGAGQVRRPDDLYAVAPGEFTAARDLLARTLKAAGDKEKAAEVKALRKPSTAAWAVNQLARRYPERMDAFLKAGEQLRAAQRKGGNAGLQEAMRAQRVLMAELMATAEKLLAQAGFRAAGNYLERVRDTLQAAPAASEAEVRQLRRGTLNAELEPADFTDVLRMMQGAGGRLRLVAPEPEDEVEETEEVEEAEVPAKRATKSAAGAKRATKSAVRAKPAAKRATKSAVRAKPAAKRATKSVARAKQAAAKSAARAKQAAAKSAARAKQEATARAKRAKQEAAKRAKQEAAAAKRAAKQSARDREAEQRQRAAATRAYEMASRDARSAAQHALDAAAKALRESREADRAEAAARKARQRADAAESAAEAAQQRAAEAKQRLEAARAARGR